MRIPLPSRTVKTLIGAVLSVTALLLTACGGGASDDQPGSGTGTGTERKHLTFVTPYGFDLAVVPVLYAAASGGFEQAGLDVEVVASNGTAQTMQQVMAGNADLGQAVGIDLISAVVDNDAPLTAFGTADQTSPFHWISLASAPLKEPKDFVGKRVGVISVGGSSEASLDIMMASAGFNPSDVARQAVGESAGVVELLNQGRINAFVGSSDILEVARSQGYDIYSFPLNQYVPTPGGVYFTTTKKAKDSAEEMTAFLTAAKAAMRHTIANKDNLSEVIGKLREKYGDKMPVLANEEEARAGIVSRIEMWTAFGEDNLLKNNEQQWKDAVATLHRAGKLKSDDPPAHLFTNDLQPAS
ncbi:ABC-type nitrate/sulfonate/bicarbonate transport system, substrate-binding protein [Pseudonocardia thermophila]|uniref:Thiamine pyrimidine synthase n=1 Tax=Pseudonocardia thermophila TaxID=1848 RepID=A0A1M6N3P3_PSETH|nr:ABC-type nitrate/sulfonate/bicarbonate transport system, substrate-binding protein [Pseudonocardia thermophila]